MNRLLLNRPPAKVDISRMTDVMQQAVVAAWHRVPTEERG